jgi:L-fuculose-phosphate aldolase
VSATPGPGDWRADAVQAIARVGRASVDQGLVVATGGNLSVRSPDGDSFLVTAAGSHLDRLDVSADALAEVELDGRHLAGPQPSTEWRLHQRTYARRPDVTAIVHVHPAYTVLLDALGRPIRLLTLDHVAYVGRFARIPFLPNGSDELADASADAAADCDCVVLAHHGCSALGPTRDAAFRVAVNLESAAQATYRMLLLGDETTEFPTHLRATAIHRRPTGD